MDGFLIYYDYALYEKKEKGPQWNEVGAHTFRDGTPDPFARAIITRLAQMMADDMYIFTSICGNGDINARNEQIYDKMKVIEKHYPMLSLCNFIACESDKRNALSKIKGMHLSKCDILIDDYKKNLAAWRNAGGTAIKYVNSINSVGDWPGPYIDSTRHTVEEAVKIILDIWHENC